MDLEEEVRSLRKKLNELYVQNKSLKQQISKARSDREEEFERAASTEKERQFLQKTLHGYAGTWAKIKKGTLEVYFNPSFEAGIFLGQYEIIFSTSGTTWKVSGCRLPQHLSTKIACKVLHSMEELTAFVQGIKQEVQAYIQRGIQVDLSKKILKESQRPSAFWHDIPSQEVLLSIPLDDTDATRNLGIRLEYESHGCLPNKVTTDALGLEPAKLEKLRKRMDLLFKSYPLQTIFEQEFGNDSKCEDSIMSDSILSQLDNL